MSDNTGGPAFPGVQYISMSGNKNPEGMTLRDYFAAKAMQALIARESTRAFDFNECPNDPWRVALWAYDVADQMLKVRQSKPHTELGSKR